MFRILVFRCLVIFPISFTSLITYFPLIGRKEKLHSSINQFDISKSHFLKHQQQVGHVVVCRRFQMQIMNFSPSFDFRLRAIAVICGQIDYKIQYNFFFTTETRSKITATNDMSKPFKMTKWTSKENQKRVARTFNIVIKTIIELVANNRKMCTRSHNRTTKETDAEQSLLMESAIGIPFR